MGASRSRVLILDTEKAPRVGSYLIHTTGRKLQYIHPSQYSKSECFTEAIRVLNATLRS